MRSARLDPDIQDIGTRWTRAERVEDSEVQFYQHCGVEEGIRKQGELWLRVIITLVWRMVL